MFEQHRIRATSDFFLTRRQLLVGVASAALAVATRRRANAEQTDSRELMRPGRPKPHVHVGTLGHRGHGKRTLTAAIDKVMAERHGGDAKRLDEIRDAAPTRDIGINVAAVYVEYESGTRRYTHAYLPEHADYLRRRAANMFEKQWFQTLIAEPIPHKQRPLQ